jgi:hypothetical protein
MDPFCHQHWNCQDPAVQGYNKYDFTLKVKINIVKSEYEIGIGIEQRDREGTCRLLAGSADPCGDDTNSWRWGRLQGWLGTEDAVPRGEGTDRGRWLMGMVASAVKWGASGLGIPAAGTGLTGGRRRWLRHGRRGCGRRWWRGGERRPAICTGRCLAAACCRRSGADMQSCRRDLWTQAARQNPCGVPRSVAPNRSPKSLWSRRNPRPSQRRRPPHTRAVVPRALVRVWAVAAAGSSAPRVGGWVGLGRMGHR